MAVYQFTYQEFDSQAQLSEPFSNLLNEARKACEKAYAPYSKFNVGAAVLLANGEIIKGVNIENASYPVGLCAERSALASVISSCPNEEIIAIAVSYFSAGGANNTPAFPCGMCRQFISECEDRNQKPIQLILAAKEGKIVCIASAKDLLPFSFGGKDLK